MFLGPQAYSDTVSERGGVDYEQRMLPIEDAWAMARTLIVKRRTQLDLTQKEAARKAGIALNTWSEVETGGRENKTVFRDLTLSAVERALEWPAGSIELILEDCHRESELFHIPEPHEAAQEGDRIRSLETRVAILEEALGGVLEELRGRVPPGSRE